MTEERRSSRCSESQQWSYSSGKSWTRHHLENPEASSIFTGPRSCFLGRCKGLQLPGTRREITAGCWTAVAGRSMIQFLIQVHWLLRIGWSNSSCWFSGSSVPSEPAVHLFSIKKKKVTVCIRNLEGWMCNANCFYKDLT